MKRHFLCIMILATTSFSVAYAQNEKAAPQYLGGECFNSFMHVDGKPLSFSVCDDALDGSPDWLDPENNQLPFSISEAIRLTRADLPRYVSDPDKWRVSSLELRTFDRNAKWFYVIEWQRKAGHVGDGLNIPVLMNGRVIHLKPFAEATKQKK